MGTLLKVQIVRHVDRKGRRVAKGTPVPARSRRSRASGTVSMSTSMASAAACRSSSTRPLPFRNWRNWNVRSLVTEPASSIPMRNTAKRTSMSTWPPTEAHLKNNVGVSPKHLKETLRRLRFVLDGCQASKLDDIRIDAVEVVLQGLAEQGAQGKTKGGAGGTNPEYVPQLDPGFCPLVPGERCIDRDLLAPRSAGIARRTGRGSHHLVASGEARSKRRAFSPNRS